MYSTELICLIHLLSQPTVRDDVFQRLTNNMDEDISIELYQMLPQITQAKSDTM